MLYKELQPVDCYVVHLSRPLSSYDRQLLTALYQPLIGPDATNLFFTYWADAEASSASSFTHYHLMNVLSMPLPQIFQARITLEAIGLLRTFQKEELDERYFYYEMLPPLDARTFFDDPLLSTFLFSKIGETAYRKARDRFIVDDLPTEGYTDISRTFLDVFTASMHRHPATQEKVLLQGRRDAQPLPFAHFSFDFDLLRQGLSEQMVPRRSLAAISEEFIAKLAFLYSFTPIDMQKVVMLALDDQLQISEERLRRAAADFYKMNISKKPPQLQMAVEVRQPPTPVEPMSQEEELYFYLDNTPPREMLRHILNKEPFSVDVQLAERFVNTHGLPVGVVNVLLQYVLLRNNGKITNSFAERIGSHWAHMKVKNAKEAIELSRKEHDQYMNWLHEGKPRNAPKRKPTREEKVPEWFYKKQTSEIQKTSKDHFDVDEERKKLLEELGVSNNEVK